MDCKLHCKQCLGEVIGKLYKGDICVKCYIEFLESELELYKTSRDLKKWKAGHSEDKIKSMNEELEAKDRTIRRLNLEAQRWFDIAMVELHK